MIVFHQKIKLMGLHSIKYQKIVLLDRVANEIKANVLFGNMGSY